MPEEAMSSKEKRVMEAHRLRYMEDLTSKEIADRLGVKPQTVRTYFSDANNEKFKRFYSDMELFKLQQTIESEVRDSYQLANNLLAQAINEERNGKDTDSKVLLKAAREAQQIRERQVKLLQELNILDKPAEEEIHRTEDDKVMERLQEAREEMLASEDYGNPVVETEEKEELEAEQ